MALSTAFGDFSGSAGDIFGGIEKNMGLQIQADGTRITAEGTRLKAQGDIVEGQNYDMASTLASQNEQFTAQSTAIKNMQADRQGQLQIGATRADIAGSGFAASGSGLDILRSGAQQAALTKQVIGQQGLITEAGFDEQSKAYSNLAGYARYSAGVENDIAGRQDELANKQDALGSFAQTAGMVTGALKGIAGIASIAML
jgi:hypothetical protein